MYQFCPLVPLSAVIYTVHFQKKNIFCFKLIMQLTNLDRKIIILYIVTFAVPTFTINSYLNPAHYKAHSITQKDTCQHWINLVWSQKHKGLPRYTLGWKTRILRFIGNLKSVTFPSMFCIFLQMQKINANF